MYTRKFELFYASKFCIFREQVSRRTSGYIVVPTVGNLFRKNGEGALCGLQGTVQHPAFNRISVKCIAIKCIAVNRIATNCIHGHLLSDIISFREVQKPTKRTNLNSIRKSTKKSERVAIALIMVNKKLCLDFWTSLGETVSWPFLCLKSSNLRLANFFRKKSLIFCFGQFGSNGLCSLPNHAVFGRHSTRKVSLITVAGKRRSLNGQF